VLELVNTVFSRCMQPSAGAPREYELAFRDGDRLIARRPPGQVPCCELLVDDAPAPGEERRAREAAALARRIRALVSGAAGVEVRERAPDGDREVGRTPRHGDIAMLFRRLTQVGRYERALREAGIPCRLVRGGGFYQAPEVRDLGELLATLADPEDAPAWAALLRSPLCAIRDGSLLAVSRLDLRTLGRRRVEEVVSTVLALGPHARDEASRLEAFLRAWHDARARRDRLDVGALLRAIVARLDLEATHLASPDGERRLLNLRKALALAERAGERGTTPRELAAHLRRMAREPPSEPEAELESGDAVALLSVHQAKGLEWPIVLVPDMGALPPRDGRRVVRDASGALAVSFHDRATDEHRPTRPLLAGREEASRAGAAESRRLLYVALTRARDRLVLSGEGSRGGETWRSLVEAGVADRPELVVRVPIADAGSFAVGPPLSPATATGTAPATATAAATAPATATAAAAADDGVVLAGPPPRSALRLAVTELAEYARCPRRFHLIRRLGLTEPQASPAGVHDDPDRATARGTLAHAMIAESDPAAPPLERRAQLLAAATRRGFDPSSPGVKRILAEVARFLEAPPGRALASAARTGRLRREVPFLLRLGESSGGAGSCYLTGAIDALVESRHELSVVDFKYALARPGVAARYRTQLLAYALAATRARPGRRVTARLQFLRGPCAAVDVTPSAAELGRFAHEAPRLAHEATRPDAAIPSPSELGRAEAQCTRERCGFVARCFRRDG
jgi:ATP-dependent exoDNAse (exonuclease V) beta subunit